jgi:hypothetical protein
MTHRILQEFIKAGMLAVTLQMQSGQAFIRPLELRLR